MLSPTLYETLHHTVSIQPHPRYIQFVNMVHKQQPDQIQLQRPIQPNICTKEDKITCLQFKTYITKRLTGRPPCGQLLNIKQGRNSASLTKYYRKIFLTTLQKIHIK